MKYVLFCVFSLMVSSWTSASSSVEFALYKNVDASPEERAEDLIGRMTLEEKVEQLGGRGIGASEFGDFSAKIFGTAGNERLGIPQLVMGHGITGVRSGRDSSVFATYMMAPIGVGASWDPELYGRASAAVAQEMLALHQDLNLGTTLNIIRHPLGGRNWECFSEDPYLTARMGVSHVKAMQSQGVIAGPKHFVANNQERNRFDINNVLDERALREIYLPAFKAAVVEGGALNIMGAYNRVNGTFMCENKWLLTDVLRGEWGFKGFVLSDFGRGVRSTIPTALSGMNIEMHSPNFYGEKLVAAVKDGALEESVVDGLLRDKLRTMFRMGLFDERELPSKEVVHSGEHQALSLELARKVPVLLKNEDSILPLGKSAYQNIAVIGPNAVLPENISRFYYLQGGGSGRCYFYPDAMSFPLDEIKAQVGEGTKVSYAQGCRSMSRRLNKKSWEFEMNEVLDDDDLIAEAVEVAGSADVTLLVLGLNGEVESEGYDRRHPRLPGHQVELLKRVSAVSEKTVVVLAGGSYVEVSEWIDDVDGLLYCFYSGEKMAQAMAEVLFGEVNPGGKLPISYPKSVDQYPSGSILRSGGFDKEGASNFYSEGIFVGYRYFDVNEEEMQFPFGFGLSYTSFEYSDIKLVEGDAVRVEVRVTNMGKVAGDEVVQLYVHDEECSIPRPVRELKGFERVPLLAGESKTVSFELGDDAFAFWSPVEKDWVVEPGVFEIQVGASSRDIRLRAELEKSGVYIQKIPKPKRLLNQ